MKEEKHDEFEDELYPLTKMFENVNESNYLQFTKLAIILYNFLFNNERTSGYDFVNWRVNFANLHEFVVENAKIGDDISIFLKYYEDSAPLLYKKLGLEYQQIQLSMITEIQRYIPPRFNRSILYTILIPEIIRSNKYNTETYVSAVTKFEMECEKKLKDLFKKVGIQSSTKRDRYSLPFTHEVIGEIEGTSYINYAFNLDNIARLFVKDLLDKDIFKIRFYLFVDVITEDETMSKRYPGKVVYKFRYMVHY